MRFKVLKSIAHNFTHSFVSFNNYVDDGYVIDDLRQLARQANGKCISIVWMSEEGSNENLSPRVLKSIEYYKAGLERFVNSSGGDVAAIKEFRTEVYLKQNKQIAVQGHIVDVSGRSYVSEVFDF